MKKILIIALLIASPSLKEVKNSTSDLYITNFNYDRDHKTVHKILSEDQTLVQYQGLSELIDSTKKTLVARKKNETVGLIHFYVDEDKGCLSSEKFGYIRLMAVAEKHRKKGYGERLFKKAEEEMQQKNVSYIYLVTDSTNKAARKLYEKNKFSSDVKDFPFFTYDSFLPMLEGPKKMYCKSYNNEKSYFSHYLIGRLTTITISSIIGLSFLINAQINEKS